jgi:hypothetical protein
MPIPPKHNFITWTLHMVITSLLFSAEVKDIVEFEILTAVNM